MKKRIKRIIMLAFAFIMVLTPVLAGMNLYNIIDANSATVNDLKKQIANQETKIANNASQRKELEAKIANAKRDQQKNYQLKEFYDMLIKSIEDNITEHEVLIGLYEKSMEQTASSIEDTQAEYERSYGLFLDLLKVTYESGNIGYLELFLKSGNLSELLSRLDNMAAMTNYTKDILAGLQDAKENIAKQNETHEMSKEQNEAKKAELAENAERLKKEQDAVDKLINRTDRDIGEWIKIQAEIDRESKAIENNIKNLLEEIAKKQTATAYVGGDMLWPVDLKHNYVSSPFGPRKSPITGQQEHHNGIDISSRHGINKANIYAANDGTVIIAQYSGSYGNYIVIDHGGGRTTLYAHANSMVKKVGDKVKRGDVIAYVGSTGWSTGPHLHFGVAENGSFKNPRDYVNVP